MQPIQVTLTFPSPAAAAGFFATLAAALPDPIHTVEPQPAPADKPVRVKPAKATEPVVETPASPATVERSAVSAAIVKLAVKDKARAIEILAGFGVKAGKDLKDEQLPEAYARVQVALAGEQ